MLDAKQEVQIEAGQIELVYRSAIRTVVGVGFVVAALAYLMTPHVPGPTPILWAAAIVGIYCYRLWIALRALKLKLEPVALIEHSKLMTALTTVMGVIAGGGLLSFFPHLPGETQALVTMICVGWIAGAVGVSGQYPRYIIPWFVAFGGSIVASWALFGVSNRWFIAPMLLLLVIYLWLAVKDIGEKTANSIRIKFHNAELVEKLEARQLEIEAASEAKSRFMAAASHDLRQPLMSINLMHASLLRATDPAETMRLARKLSRPVKSLESILDSLVEVSRLDAGGVVPHHEGFDLTELGEEISDEFLPRAELNGVALGVQAEAATVIADRHLVSRILRNLIDNALKFTEAGAVEIALSCPDSRTLALTVADTGRGIPAHELDQIFKDYYQIGTRTPMHTGGIGLGLAIVRRLVDIQKGHIAVESAEGKGSVFRIRLEAPTAPSRQLVPSADAISQEVAPRPLQVFFIDDEPSIQDGMAEWGTTHGHCLYYASNGDEAVELATSLERRPDAIVADFHLPGANGLEVIAALQRRWPAIPAILVSGATEPEVLDAARTARIPVLRKPVAGDRLEAEIMAMLGR